MIIAEIAQAHDGSLGILHSYIDALSNTGVDAIKFQVHIADAESSEFETFRVPFSYEDKTRMDYWKRMEFSQDQWLGIKEHCEKVGLQFIVSPFSIKAIEMMEQIGIRTYKIASGEVTNLLLLDAIKNTQKPVIISSGMSNYDELAKAIEIFASNAIEYAVLQCTTSYPALPHQWGLNVIQELKQRFNCKVGYSDHSGDIYACLAAATLGAEIFEFHAVFHKEMFGPDTKSSIDINSIAILTKGIKQIQAALAAPANKNNTLPYFVFN